MFYLPYCLRNSRERLMAGRRFRSLSLGLRKTILKPLTGFAPFRKFNKSQKFYSRFQLDNSRTMYKKSHANFLTGFTLLETIVALGIILGGVTGAFGLAIKGLSIASVSKNKLIAVNLAQEGIELVRRIRDNNTIADISDGFYDGSPEWTAGIGSAADCNQQYKIDVSNSALLSYDMTPLRLDSATGERVWDVLSSNPAFLALDPTDSRLYVLSYMGDGRRYDTADGSVLGEWGGTERNVDSVATDGSYFYYSGRVYSPSADWPVWVRRSYDLETYEWFWNPWEEGFVNEPPQGGKMVLGNGMLYGATNEGVNCYSTAEGDRLWFLPVNLMEGMQYTYQYTGVAAGDGTAAYVLYRAVRYSSSSLLEIVEKRNRLLKISGGEVVWGTEVGNLNDAVAAVVHATRDTIFVAISEGDRVKRFSTLDGSEF